MIGYSERVFHWLGGEGYACDGAELSAAGRFSPDERLRSLFACVRTGSEG